MLLEVGMQAPQWTAQVEGGESLALSLEQNSLSSSQLTGTPYVIYFYPKDSTPGCTTQACDFRDRLEVFKSLGYLVIGVSPDSMKSHGRFREKQALTFPLISDDERVVSEAFGVWQEKKNYGRTYMGVVRSTFVVDANGVITHAQYNVRAKGHVERLYDLLSS